MEEVVIRRMTEGDLQAVKEIEQRLVEGGRVVTWLDSVDTVWFTHRPALNLLAEISGQAVGFLLGDIRGADYALPFGGWIDMMGVLPELQRRGIGRRLAEEFLARCRANKVSARVIIREDDKRLVRFWSALGFRRAGLIALEKL